MYISSSVVQQLDMRSSFLGEFLVGCYRQLISKYYFPYQCFLAPPCFERQASVWILYLGGTSSEGPTELIDGVRLPKESPVSNPMQAGFRIRAQKKCAAVQALTLDFAGARSSRAEGQQIAGARPNAQRRENGVADGGIVPPAQRR
jgi:hypothetical protein